MSGMSRFSGCIYNVHIADGFVDDCEELIYRCSKKEPLTYKAFCIIWKEMNFATIYQNRNLGSEVAELSEEVILIAKRYMVANTSNFEESVAGMFLVYALLNLQPFSGFAALRLVSEDMPAISRIEFVARRERRLDILYILGSILVRGPCQFHAEQRERGMELPLRKYLEGFTTIDRTGVRPKGVFYRQNDELDIIREVNTIFRRYVEAKTSAQGKLMDPSLKYSDHTVGIKMETTLKKIISGLAESDEEHPGPSTSGYVSNAQAIKSKAMRNVVNSMRHLTGVSEKKSSSPSPKKSNSRIKAVKVKPRSPPKSVITSHKNRIRTPPKTSKTKRPRRTKLNSSSSFSGDDDDTSVGDDLDLESFGQQVKVRQEIDENKEQADDTQMDQELDIKIDSLPVLIRADDNDKYIEIEIIDQYKANEKETERQDEKEKTGELLDEDRKRKLRKKLFGSKDISVKKVKQKGERFKKTPRSKIETVTEMAKLSKITSASDDFVFTKPSENQSTKKTNKLERRGLKKSVLMSKFKRMGILPMANFEESN